jgi:flagellar protein FlaG
MSVKGILKQVATYQGIDKLATSTSNDVNMAQSSVNLSTSNSKKAVTVELGSGSNETGQQKEQNSEATRIKNAMNEINNKLKPTKTRCEFSYHEEVNRVTIKILDRETNEVVREIPPEESIKVLEKVYEIAGLLVDEKR